MACASAGHKSKHILGLIQSGILTTTKAPEDIIICFSSDVTILLCILFPQQERNARRIAMVFTVLTRVINRCPEIFRLLWLECPVSVSFSFLLFLLSSIEEMYDWMYEHMYFAIFGITQGQKIQPRPTARYIWSF